MKNMKVLNENKIFFAIILAAIIIGFSIFLSISFTNISPTGAAIEGAKGQNDGGGLDSIVIEIKESATKGAEEQKMVTKIIDGDTVIIEGGSSIRLLGIDTDERGYPCYTSAKQRIEELVLNKEVQLVSDTEDKDQYGRYLRYIILDGENINLKMVEEGLAVARFYPENVKYREEITSAEKYAVENGIGCKWGGEISVNRPVQPVIDATWSELAGDAIGACNAGNYVGQEKVVEGFVADGYKSKTSTVFLNLEKPYPNHCFTAVIFSSGLINFPENPEAYYDGKLVRVKGIIKEYNGKPEIILNDRSQIEVGGE